MARGRPRKPLRPVRVVLTLRLDPRTDGDLIDLFARVPPRRRAALIRAALRGADLRAVLPPREEEAIEAALDHLGETLGGLR